MITSERYRRFPDPLPSFAARARGNSPGEQVLEVVMARDSGPESGVKGIAEDLKGKAKEVVGEVTGDDRKEREGRAQQDKAQSQRDVAKKEAEADAARSEAAVHEAEQRTHQQ